MYRILVVDDTASVLSFVRRVLLARGFDVVTAVGGEEALKLLASEPVDVVISDIKMEPVSGLDLLMAVQKKDPSMPVILMTAYEDLESAASALKNNAFDYLIKPVDLNDLVATCNRAAAYRRALEGVVGLATIVGRYAQLGDMVVESAGMQELSRLMQQLAPVDKAILIIGEKGSGRTLVAKGIHDNGPRRDKSFVAFDCSKKTEPAPRSMVSADAREGTLFLRHVDEMAPALRQQLLKELTQLDVECEKNNMSGPRVVASSVLDAEGLVNAGFDQEFVNRITEAVLMVPPLRERKAEILALTYHLFRRFRGDAKVMPEAELEVCDVFERYTWPGNVDELESIVRRVAEKGSENMIMKTDLPAGMLESAGRGPAFDKEQLKEAFMHSESLKRFLREAKRGESERLKNVVSEATPASTTAQAKSKAHVTLAVQKPPPG